MGFGWLLIGYFTATVMSLNILGALFKTVGFSVAAFGIKKLSSYHKSFTLLLAASAFAIAVSAGSAIATVTDFLHKNLLIPQPLVSSEISDFLLYIRAGAELVFTVLMCVSIALIAKETGAPKLVYVAVRNLVIYAVYFIIQIVCWLPTDLVGELLQKAALPVWALILSLATAILNSIMLFSCYGKICDENDIDMPQKPSRFAFVNRMRAERDERAAERAARRARPNKKQEVQMLDNPVYSEEQMRRSAESARKKKKNK